MSELQTPQSLSVRRCAPNSLVDHAAEEYNRVEAATAAGSTSSALMPIGELPPRQQAACLFTFLGLSPRELRSMPSCKLRASGNVEEAITNNRAPRAFHDFLTATDTVLDAILRVLPERHEAREGHVGTARDPERV